MGKLTTFEIRFNNAPQDVFYAGQTIDGSVTVVLKEPMKMRGIYLTVKGQANTRFRTHVGSGKRRRRRWVSAWETYMNNKFPVFGRDLSGTGEEVTELPAGQHVFPFQCQLPPNLPSSFEGRHGHVRYIALGNIDKPWKFDHTTIRMFCLLCPLDLNMDPSFGQPTHNEQSKTNCCCCCKSAPISGSLSVPKKGYVPGELITYSGDANNGTPKQMRSTNIKLLMVTTFLAGGGKRQASSETIVDIQKPPLGPSGSATWTNESVQLPPLPPSGLMHCNIIHIHYYLQISVDPGALTFNLLVPVEIIVGTIPLRQTFPQYWAQQGSAMAGDGNIQPALPPPSYGVCTGGEEEPGANPDEGNEEVEPGSDDEGPADGRNEYTMGQKNFNPVYPFYKY